MKCNESVAARLKCEGMFYYAQNGVRHCIEVTHVGVNAQWRAGSPTNNGYVGGSSYRWGKVGNNKLSTTNASSGSTKGRARKPGVEQSSGNPPMNGSVPPAMFGVG